MSDDLASDDSTDQDPDLITPADLVAWLEEFISEVESVDRSSGQHWCSQWWNHPEAVSRFRALHEKWLEAQEEGGMSGWWVDHFDSHAAVLFAKRGPFGECGTTHQPKTSRRVLACEAPPTDWSWD